MAIFKGTTIPYDPVLREALGDADAALAVQQLAFLGLKSADGWVAMSVRALARELGCSDSRAERALRRMRDTGLLETRGGGGPIPARHRLHLAGVADLLPHRHLNFLYVGKVSGETSRASQGEEVTSDGKRLNDPSSSRAHARADQRRPDQTRPHSSSPYPSSPRGRAHAQQSEEAVAVDQIGGHKDEEAPDIIAAWKAEAGW
jgi:DNA-binding transcriptional MocR family regulator